MFLSSPWLEIYRFSNWSFCWLWAVQNWWSFCWIWPSQNSPYLFIFNWFGQVSVFLQNLGKTLDRRKQSKLSLSDKKIQEPDIGSGKSHFQWFSQWESRTSWVLQLINRLQKFNLLLLSATLFSDLCNKIKHAW